MFNRKERAEIERLKGILLVMSESQTKVENWLAEEREEIERFMGQVATLQRDKEHLESHAGEMETANQGMNKARNEALLRADQVRMMYVSLFVGLGKREATVQFGFVGGATNRADFIVSFVPKLKGLFDQEFLDRIAKQFPPSDGWAWFDSHVTKRVWELNESILGQIDGAEAELQGHITRCLQVQAYSEIAKKEVKVDGG